MSEGMKKLFLLLYLFHFEGLSDSSERSVLDICPECVSTDQTAYNIKKLSGSVCEQMVNSEQCRDVDPDYLRDCNEEEEGTLAFGQRVVGCMYGAGFEGAVGLGLGFALGKVIVGIGALMSIPVLGPALGVKAGGVAALYVYSEYARSYQQEDDGAGRALKAAGSMLGNIGTKIYRLFLGNYECYNARGRAWEVCGLLLGGVVGGKAALSAVKKTAEKTKELAEGTVKSPHLASVESKPPVLAVAKKEPFSGLGLTQAQEKILHKKINSDFVSYSDLSDLRKSGIRMDDVAKAFRMPHVGKQLKNNFEQKFTQLQKVKNLLGSKTLSDRQIEGVGDLLDSQSFEAAIRGMRKTGLSFNDVMSFQTGRNTNPYAMKSYIKKRSEVEQSIGNKFTEEQSQGLSMIQMYFRTGPRKGLSESEKDNMRYYIRNLIQSGIPGRELRNLVQAGGKWPNRILNEVIDESL